MPEADSISAWIVKFKAGDQDAVDLLWNAFREKLKRYARSKLAGRRIVQDDDDAVISAFHEFCRGVQRNQFPELSDRLDLWKILTTITSRKVSAYSKKEQRQRRGNGKVFREADQHPRSSHLANGKLDDLATDNPGPQFQVAFAEELQRLLAVLKDEELITVAKMRLDGYSNAEIASCTERSNATVERRLRTVREIWRYELNIDDI